MYFQQGWLTLAKLCIGCRRCQLSFCALKIGIFRELKKLQNANITFYMFPFFSFWRVHWNMYSLWASRVCLKCTTALDQTYLSYVSVPRKVNPGHAGWCIFCTVPRPHFLGRALIWPGYFDEHILGLFGLHPSSLSKSAGFVFLSGKASLVSISAAILLLRSWHVYFLLEFDFHGKICVDWEHGGEDGISCLLPCIL